MVASLDPRSHKGLSFRPGALFCVCLPLWSTVRPRSHLACPSLPCSFVLSMPPSHLFPLMLQTKWKPSWATWMRRSQACRSQRSPRKSRYESCWWLGCGKCGWSLVWPSWAEPRPSWFPVSVAGPRGTRQGTRRDIQG